MKISVVVKAGAKENRVEKIEEARWQVRVKAPAREGKANEAVIQALSDYFGKPRSRIRLVTGAASKNKVFEIQE